MPLVLMPDEATDEMTYAGWRAMHHDCRPTPARVSIKEKHRIRYRAMVAARPPVPESVVEEWAKVFAEVQYGNPGALPDDSHRAEARALIEHLNRRG